MYGLHIPTYLPWQQRKEKKGDNWFNSPPPACLLAAVLGRKGHKGRKKNKKNRRNRIRSVSTLLLAALAEKKGGDREKVDLCGLQKLAIPVETPHFSLDIKSPPC